MAADEPYARAHLFKGLERGQLATLQEFVPDAFFEEGVDATGIVLAMLPLPSDPSFMEQLQRLERGEARALEIVSRNLNKNLLDNYQDVLQAMNMISTLNQHQRE